MVAKVQKFISEVIAELKKVSWSTKQEVIDSTILILITSAILGVFIGIVDFSLSRVLQLIIRS